MKLPMSRRSVSQRVGRGLVLLLALVWSVRVSAQPPGGSEAATQAGKTEKSAPATPAGETPKPATGGPNAVILLKNFDELLSDLKFVFDTAKAPKQYESLAGNLEVFLTGLDRTKLVSVQSWFDKKGERHIGSLPVEKAADLPKFLQNISDLDIKSKLVAGQKTLYSLNVFGTAEAAFLRYDAKLGLVFIAPSKDDVLRVKAAPAAALLGDYDLVLQIDNGVQPASDRKESFQKIRDNLLQAVKQGPKEQADDFEIRKLSIEQQLAELERFLVDSSTITLGWTTETQQKMAALQIDLAALPMTSLAESIALLGQKPDDFAGVGSEQTESSISVNFPIDKLRQGHLLASLKLWKPRALKMIDANAALSDAQKQERREFAELASQVVEGVANLETANGFVRIYPGKSNKHTTVLAVKVANEAPVVDLLKKHAERVGPEKMKLDAHKEGDVAIHTIFLTDEQKLYPELFDDKGTLFVGTSPGAVWFAYGDEALDRLQKAVQAVAKGEKKAGGPAVDIHGNVAPWVEILDRRLGAIGDPELRKIALEALKEGQDTLTFRIERVADAVKVKVEFHEGLIRFAGKVMAKVVKDSLE